MSEVSALSSETSVVMSSTESQTHAHIEHYLSQRRWDILGDEKRDLDSKLEEVTDLLHDEIGCSHPREIPTQQ